MTCGWGDKKTKTMNADCERSVNTYTGAISTRIGTILAPRRHRGRFTSNATRPPRSVVMVSVQTTWESQTRTQTTHVIGIRLLDGKAERKSLPRRTWNETFTDTFSLREVGPRTGSLEGVARVRLETRAFSTKIGLVIEIRLPFLSILTVGEQFGERS